MIESVRMVNVRERKWQMHGRPAPVRKRKVESRKLKFLSLELLLPRVKRGNWRRIQSRRLIFKLRKICAFFCDAARLKTILLVLGFFCAFFLLASVTGEKWVAVSRLSRWKWQEFFFRVPISRIFGWERSGQFFFLALQGKKSRFIAWGGNSQVSRFSPWGMRRVPGAVGWFGSRRPACVRRPPRVVAATCGTWPSSTPRSPQRLRSASCIWNRNRISNCMQKSKSDLSSLHRVGSAPKSVPTYCKF